MSIRSILVPLDGTTADRRCLDTALTLARQHHAHITALHAAADPREIPLAFVGDGTGIYVTEQLLNTMRDAGIARQTKAVACFTDWREAAQIPLTTSPATTEEAPTAHLIVETGIESALIRLKGLVTDLIIAPLPGEDEISRAESLESGLFDAGRPVLGVPVGHHTPYLPDAPVAIAWNGSAESARAVAAALPLLTKARDVVVLHVGKETDLDAVAPVIQWLGWHGIVAQGRVLPAVGDTGAQLIKEAEQLGATLLVMGAYSHSRAREWVFGGVTSFALAKAGLHLLLAH